MMSAKTKSALLFSSVALASVLALSACGNSGDPAASPGPSASAPAASAPAASESPASPAAGETKEITIKATNFAFDQTEIKAKVGDTLKITLQNESGLHGMRIDGLNVDIKDGETATIVLDKPGTYDYYCTIMCGTGHDNMTGQIIVE